MERSEVTKPAVTNAFAHVGYSSIFKYITNLAPQPSITMSQIKKEDVKQEVFDLYDDYAHNRIERR
ncbi:MAG: hypothetical protein LW863_07025, partial [Flammeovirgaceae bacterium]|nr:hypothetical protein [Flammeovirgaceae bacterium]